MLLVNNVPAFVTAYNASDAWEQWYQMLCEQKNTGFQIPSRDGAVVGEFLNAVTTIQDPSRGICTSKYRGMPMRYAVGELLYYLSGSNQLPDIAQYSNAWEKLSDDGFTVNSSYGYRIHSQFGFDQWNFVARKLCANPYDRQAVIHIKDASNKVSKDVPCTLSLQFQIRAEKLFLTTIMRSNDIWMGWPYDVFSFTALQVLMCMQLNKELDKTITLGSYTHIAGSLHLYERDYREEAYLSMKNSEKETANETQATP